MELYEFSKKQEIRKVYLHRAYFLIIRTQLTQKSKAAVRVNIIFQAKVAFSKI